MRRWSMVCYVLITENMVDQPFPDKYCVGSATKTCLPARRKTVTTKPIFWGCGKDGIAKTPERAAQITGIPADRIIKLAREIGGGSAKPAYICQVGPLRHALMEKSPRAPAPMLSAYPDGNVGINGGNSGAREGSMPCHLNVYAHVGKSG